jgi:hypothetical protein
MSIKKIKPKVKEKNDNKVEKLNNILDRRNIKYMKSLNKNIKEKIIENTNGTVKDLLIKATTLGLKIKKRTLKPEIINLIATTTRNKLDENIILKERGVEKPKLLKKETKKSILKITNDKNIKKAIKKYHIDENQDKKTIVNEIVNIIKENEKVIVKTKEQDIVKNIDKFSFYREDRIFTNIKTIEQLYNRIREYIKDYKLEKYVLLFVKVWYKSKIGNTFLCRSIKAETFSNLKYLIQWFDDIINSPEEIVKGSDGVDNEEFDLDLTHFDIITVKDERFIKGHGDNFINDFFEIMDIVHEKNNCGYACLKIINPKLSLTEYNNKKLMNLEKMKEYIKVNKFNVKIIGNYIKLKQETELNNFIELQVGNRHKMLQKINEEDIEVPIYHICEKPTHIIIYDVNCKHYEITKELKFKNDIYFSEFHKIYIKKEEIIKEIDNIPKKYENLVKYELIKKVECKTEFIFFDYETVTDWNEKNVNKPYSLAILRCNEEQLLYLNNIEETHNQIKNDLKLISQKNPWQDNKKLVKNLKKIDDMLNSHYYDQEDRNVFTKHKFDKNNLKSILVEMMICNKIILHNFKKFHSEMFIGFNCTEQLLDYIQKEQKDLIFRLVSFNGCNFDNFILYNEYCKYKKLHQIDKIDSEPCIANGQLLDFTIFNKHRMLDVRKHIGGSLLENCFSFKVELCKKIEGFSHYEMQKKYDNGTLEEFINNSTELYSYNVYDCLSLAIIFYRYKIAIEKIKGFEYIIVENYYTLGQLVMDVFEKHCKDNNIILPSFYITKKKYDDMIGRISDKAEYDYYNEILLDYYKDIVKYRVAGRVQLFNGIQKIEERLNSLDVCSLYPYVMMIGKNYYPCGDVFEVKKYIDMPKDKIGYFYCDVDQSKLKIKIVPEKTINGNDWDVKQKLENIFISSIMIKYLKSIGADVDIKNGIYFEDKIKGCELFEPLLVVMKLKNEQDVLKENKSEQYNQVLREIYKLILNILSGKLNQKLNKEKRRVINHSEFLELQTSKKTESINAITCINGKVHVSLKLNDEDCIRTAKPISIGALIYDYAKIYMHKHMYSKIEYENLIYTDTDSNKLRIDDFNKWKKYAENKNVNHWTEIEKYDERYIEHKLFSSDSKVFGSFEDEYKDNNNNLSYYLQKKTYLTLDTTLKDRMNNMTFENEREKNLYEKKFISFHFKGVSNKDIVINNINIIEKTDNKKLCDIYNDKNSIKIKDNYEGFFENLYKNKKVDLLTCSLQRVSNNLKKNTTNEQFERMNNKCYNIVTSYRIKSITIT